MATPPDRRKMRNNPVNGKKKKKRKVIKGIRMDAPKSEIPKVAGTSQAVSQTFTTKTPYGGKTTTGVGSKSGVAQQKKRVKKLTKKRRSKRRMTFKGIIV